MEIRFAADCNVGKLARWLRMMGYDTLFFRDIDDGQLVDIAMKEGRVVLSRDTGLMRRKVVASGQVKMLLLRDDNPKEQLRHVMTALDLGSPFRLFSRCLECNHALEPRAKEELRGIVPPYVFLTQSDYMQCPSCRRIYWRGTHWQRMRRELERLTGGVFDTIQPAAVLQES